MIMHAESATRGKILFVQPPISLRERYGELGTVGTDTAPLGICHLASMTRQAGYPSAILDAPALAIGIDDMVQRTLEARPRHIAVTATVIAIERAADYARKLREAGFDGTIILGGAQLAAAPYETMRLAPEFDIGLLGEGELTIVELLNTLEGGGNLEEVAGLLVRKDDEVIMTAARSPIQNLDALPFPAWELLPQPLSQFYRPAAFTTKSLPSFSMITSRGCYAKCTFCDRAVFGNLVRNHSAAYVLDMMEVLYRQYGIREFAIADDLFIVFKQRLVDICEGIIERGLKVSWSCNARVDHVTDDITKLMRRAGCWQIAYGVESGAEEILQAIEKGTSMEKIKEAIRVTRRNGIRVRGYFMLGSPGETEETMQKTIDFVKDVHIDDFQLTYFTPLPGSEIYDTAEQYGAFERNNSSLNYWQATFVPYGLTRETIQQYYRKAYRLHYFRPSTVWSYLKLVRTPEKLLRLFQGAYGLGRLVFLNRTDISPQSAWE